MSRPRWPQSHAVRMCNEVWTFLEAKQGIVRDNPSTWTESRPTGFAPLSRSKGFDRFWSPVVSEILTEVFAQPRQSRERARVLMTFPQSDKAWSVPSVGWHFDFAPLQERPGLRAAQVFGLLSPVRPKGGGTLVLRDRTDSSRATWGRPSNRRSPRACGRGCRKPILG